MSSQYRTVLQFVNGTVTSPYYLDNIINSVIVPSMKNTGLISSSSMTMLQLMEVASLGNGNWKLGYLEWSDLHFCPHRNLIENLWDQRRCHLEAHNSVPQNLNECHPSRRVGSHASADK
ncbi:hypothetical protein ATANTOWER_030588 [Ataeniobius toweri]|uniref:Uncharacterized protein n=1 Tax=Ataeniobius toweri TaxID=208326 RepID=A0ABU7CC92_9TELE|nr:hypothetical protein [Ataeniobius toweri]